MIMNRALILNLMRSILSRRGVSSPAVEEGASLAELGFRSLDFAELCLRVEECAGHELSLGAGVARRLQSVGDVCELLEELAVRPAA
jgi:acyl carrier protein